MYAQSFLFKAILVFLLFFCPLGAKKSSPLVIDLVHVYKDQRKMELLSRGVVVKTYAIALGGSPLGPKTQEGDNKTPEGRYVLDWRNPKSAFHKSIHISYPNTKDRLDAKNKNKSPGGDIFLHGLGHKWSFLGKAHTMYDWTRGCVAVSNNEMDEIWDLVPNGTPIHIMP
jgi:murein L,D-transpeptidase YafK